MTIQEILSWFREERPTPLTREESEALFKQTRSYFREVGREIGKTLCINGDGTTHSRAVYWEMKRQGLPVDSIDGRWMGALFTGSAGFQPTGETYIPGPDDYADSTRGTHPRGITDTGCRIWRYVGG